MVAKKPKEKEMDKKIKSMPKYKATTKAAPKSAVKKKK